MEASWNYRVLPGVAGWPTRNPLGWNTYGQPTEPPAELGVDATRFPNHLDLREARQDFLPQDLQLQFGQPVADTAMDAETERQMLPRARAVDDEAVRVFDRLRIAV